MYERIYATCKNHVYYVKSIVVEDVVDVEDLRYSWQGDGSTLSESRGRTWLKLLLS